MSLPRNPVDLWSFSRFAATISLLVLAVVVSGLMIWVSDIPLRARQLPRSTALEWPLWPSAVHSIVDQYKDANAIGDAVRGVMIDTFFFIPSYAAESSSWKMAADTSLIPRARNHPALRDGSEQGWAVHALAMIALTPCRRSSLLQPRRQRSP